MARIFGTIESLKSLKIELENNGISRFKSVKEINTFLANYNKEKKYILNQEAERLETEYNETCSYLEHRKKLRAEIKEYETEKIDTQISDLKARIDTLNAREVNFLQKIFSSKKIKILY